MCPFLPWRVFTKIVEVRAVRRTLSSHAVGPGFRCQLDVGLACGGPDRTEEGVEVFAGWIA